MQLQLCQIRWEIQTKKTFGGQARSWLNLCQVRGPERKISLFFNSTLKTAPRAAVQSHPAEAKLSYSKVLPDNIIMSLLIVMIVFLTMKLMKYYQEM